MKKFAIVNRYAPKHIVGYLEYNEKKEEFKVTSMKDVPPSKLPFIMQLFAEKGIYELDPEWSARWVRDRIVPSGRQNIGAILKEHGLQFYNEMVILENTRGRCVQDDFEIVPVKDEDPPFCRITPIKTFSPAQIKQIRNQCKLTQACFAKCLGVTSKAVEAWESGRTRPNGAACRLLEIAQKNPRFFADIGIVKK